ncbi:MAG: delta-aminolevulinic acid dehydratase [Chloroflexi bacterium RBG_16_72_14]|nr:MAG: delta-aminolevulinic acid dehydratase [Chloroflexi bacterium RBG_16_72_14]
MSLVEDHPAAAPAGDVPAPTTRPRRTRRTEALRAFVRETRIHPRQLVAPLFVFPGQGLREPVGSMPGVERVTPDEAVRDARALEALGVGGLILFGLPADKDAVGTGGWIRDGIVQETLRRLRDADLDLVLVADTCLCEYTDHGHCGPLLADGRVDNEATIELYARTAVSQAAAGADIVAPSGMMDGQVAAIRHGLDQAGAIDTAILAYAAKTASAFYGPFRDAAGSTPAFGDRRGYQMDPANARESMREMAIDVAEGADMLLVKPALPSLDILAAARARFDVPIGAYQVSGEFASIEAAAQRGWLDRRRALTESTTAILRAGAGFVITYAAADLAAWAREA